MENMRVITATETIKVPEMVTGKNDGLNRTEMASAALQQEIKESINKDISDEDLKEITEKEVSTANKLMSVLNSKLKFVTDERSKTGLVVQIISKETGELVRQIPPEELLDLMARLKETVIGIFLDKNV